MLWLPLAEEAHQQSVFAILHIGRDLHKTHFRAVVISRVAAQILFPSPLAVDRVNREAHVVLVFPPAPAQVHAADLGGRGIADFQQGLATAAHLGLGHLHHAVFLGEFVGGDQLIAEPLALLVVRGDPISPFGGDLLDLIEPWDAHRLAFGVQLERCAAVAAQLRFSGIAEVGMAAGAADQRVLRGQGRRTGSNGVVLQAEQCALHLVGVALVIDQRVGSEFTDAHKAWAGDVGATAHLLAGAGDVGHQR